MLSEQIEVAIALVKKMNLPAILCADSYYLFITIKMMDAATMAIYQRWIAAEVYTAINHNRLFSFCWHLGKSE